MIKLSDYLDYLNTEIIQARKAADENAVKVAKEYAAHEYLKYFKVPRYIIPVIKMDIPLKITDINADSKFNFKNEPLVFLKEVNDKIREVNVSKNLKIATLDEKDVTNKDFTTLFKSLENKDQRFTKNLGTEIKKIDLTTQLKSLKVNVFRPQAEDKDAEDTELNKILADSLSDRFNLVSSKIKDIFIDPNTSGAVDKDKLFINLHVEMEEEGIRIMSFTDKNGNKVEEITFE